MNPRQATDVAAVDTSRGFRVTRIQHIGACLHENINIDPIDISNTAAVPRINSNDRKFRLARTTWNFQRAKITANVVFAESKALNRR